MRGRTAVRATLFVSNKGVHNDILKLYVVYHILYNKNICYINY